MANVAIIIPSRYGSSRLPGKPLVKIAGRTLIERVYRLAQAVPQVSHVVVATDDDRIAKTVAGFGGEYVMTGEARNGSERCWAAIQKLPQQPDIVVNFQGDAVLTPPWVIEPLVKALVNNSALPMATPAVKLSAEEAKAVRASAVGAQSGTYVVFAQDHRALYFSKFPIPFVRSDSDTSATPLYRHIGIYAYQTAALARYITLSPTPAEKGEQLEQLRALEHDMPMMVCEVDLRGRTLCSIDTPGDVTDAEAIIAREGELL